MLPNTAGGEGGLAIAVGGPTSYGAVSLLKIGKTDTIVKRP
ncbi:hypothetical protein [Geitlerinema sp. PCC 9228]|nr:hypothetical protein [Geitlerinema sp. PCC 9228]